MRRAPYYPTRRVGPDPALPDVELLTFVGPPGVGKTRLAADLGRPRGVVWIDISGALTPDELARAALRDLGVPPEVPAGDPVTRAATRLAGHAHVVLDHAEVGAALGEVLAAWRGPRWTVTAREALGLPGEVVHPVCPLPVDGEADDAIALFFRALPRLGPTPLDPARDRAHVRAVVAGLGGLPAAIELTAGQSAVASIHDLVAASAPTLEGTVQRAIERLPKPTALVVAALSVFEGPFDLPAASAVAGCDVADHLQIAVARYLAAGDADGRFRLPGVVRGVARALLRVRGASGETEERHAVWVAGLPVDRRSRWSTEVDAVLARSPLADLLLGTPTAWTHRSTADLLALVDARIGAGSTDPRLRVARAVLWAEHTGDAADIPSGDDAWSARAAAARPPARSVWRIERDGFAAPGGAWVGLNGRPTLAKISWYMAGESLANGGGSDVDALFAAGWPGEDAAPDVRGNRVRVAVATLRGLGLTCLAWKRGRGWWLDGEVGRAAPMLPG